MSEFITVFFFRFFNIFKSQADADRRLAIAIKNIVGRRPINLALYQLAFRHTSASRVAPKTGVRESNERLEYLGDAILGAVIAEYLFKKYPYQEEGFLTDIRSRIVNRESLNQIARKMGIEDLIEYEGSKKHRLAYKSMNGDALEALVGAIYLDRGFHFCRKFILKKLVQNQIDIDELISNNKNFKSRIIEWAQKENRELSFEIIKEKGSKHQRIFVSQIIVDEKPLAVGNGLSKKKAEQAAAEQACKILKID